MNGWNTTRRAWFGFAILALIAGGLLAVIRDGGSEPSAIDTGPRPVPTTVDVRTADDLAVTAQVSGAGHPGAVVGFVEAVAFDAEVQRTQAEAYAALIDAEQQRQAAEAALAAARQRQSAPASSGGGTSDRAYGDDVWAALAQCESGGNAGAATGNGFYGAFQFLPGTWQSVGGTGLPHQASYEEQKARAQTLQARSGWGQWPACSAKLGLR